MAEKTKTAKTTTSRSRSATVVPKGQYLFCVCGHPEQDHAAGPCMRRKCSCGEFVEAEKQPWS